MIVKVIRESAGDKKLYKFYIYKIDIIPGICEKNYDSILNAYLFYDEYYYNIYTRQTNDKYVTHSDIFDKIPHEIRQRSNDEFSIVGKTDCYLNNKKNENPIRMWFTGNVSLLSNSDRNYLKDKFHADYIK